MSFHESDPWLVIPWSATCEFVSAQTQTTIQTWLVSHSWVIRESLILYTCFLISSCCCRFSIQVVFSYTDDVALCAVQTNIQIVGQVKLSSVEFAIVDADQGMKAKSLR